LEWFQELLPPSRRSHSEHSLMGVDIYQMKSTSNNVSIEYKKCAGKGCDRVGKTLLKIRYLNKTGLFCDRCTKDLLISELATKVGNGSK
jgi:hypothetical protein